MNRLSLSAGVRNFLLSGSLNSDETLGRHELNWIVLFYSCTVTLWLQDQSWVSSPTVWINLRFCFDLISDSISTQFSIFQWRSQFCPYMKEILRELGSITLPLGSPLLRILWASSGRNESRGRPSPLQAPPCRTHGTLFCFEYVSWLYLQDFTWVIFTTQNLNFQCDMSTLTEVNNLNTSFNSRLGCFYFGWTEPLFLLI